MYDTDIFANLTILGSLGAVGLFAWWVMRKPAVVDSRPSQPPPPDPPETRAEIKAEIAASKSGKPL